MTARDYLSEDGMAVFLLCSMLGIEEKTAPGFAAPFTLSEWNKLAVRLPKAALKSPAGLFGQNATVLAKTLEIPLDESERVAKLLERAGRVTMELESLFSRGIWVVTCVDEQYPSKL